MNEAQREEIARILEMIAAEGLPHPRNLDAAIDAITDVFLQTEILTPAYDHSYRETKIQIGQAVWHTRYETWSEYHGREYMTSEDEVHEKWMVV